MQKKWIVLLFVIIFLHVFSSILWANDLEIDISSRIIENDSNNSITISAYPPIAGLEFEVKGSTKSTNDIGECVFSITPTAEETIPVKLFSEGSWETVGYIYVVNSLAEKSLLRVKFVPDSFQSSNENMIYVDDVETIMESAYLNYADYIVTTAAHNIKFSGFDTESCSYIIDEDIPKSQEYLLDMTTLSLNALSFTFNNAPCSIDGKFGVCDLNETVCFCLNLDNRIYYSNNILEDDLLTFQNICFEDYQTSSLMQMSNYVIDTQGNTETSAVLNLAYNSVVIESSVFENQKTYYAYLATEDENKFSIDCELGSCFTVQLLDSQESITYENQESLTVDTTDLAGNYVVKALLADNSFYPSASGQINESFTSDSLNLISVFPEADATAVQVDTNITITFGDTITTSDNFGAISIIDENEMSAFDISHKYIMQEKIKIDLNVNFTWENATTYTVSIPANAVKDFDERANEAFSFSFTTVSLNNPQVVNKYPEVNAVDVPCNSNIVISFDKNIQLGMNEAKLFENELNGEEIQVTLNTNASELIIHPDTRLDNNTRYYVYVPPGAVESLENNSLENGFSYSFTTEEITVKPTKFPANYTSFRVLMKANNFSEDMEIELKDSNNIDILSGYDLTSDNSNINGVLYLDSAYNNGNGLIADAEYILRIFGTDIDLSKMILASDKPIIREIFPAKISSGILGLNLELQGYNFNNFTGNEFVTLEGAELTEASTSFTVNNSQSANAQFIIDNYMETGMVLVGTINYPEVIYYDGNSFSINVSNDAYVYRLDRDNLFETALNWTSENSSFSFTGYNINSSNFNDFLIRLYDSNEALVAQFNFDSCFEDSDGSVTLNSELSKDIVNLDGYYEVEVVNEELLPIGPVFGFTIDKPHISKAEVLDNQSIKLTLAEAYPFELLATDFQVIQGDVNFELNSVVKSLDNLEVILFLEVPLAEGQLEINNYSTIYDSSAFIKGNINKNISNVCGVSGSSLKEGDILYKELLSSIYISSPVDEIFITFVE